MGQAFWQKLEKKGNAKEVLAALTNCTFYSGADLLPQDTATYFRTHGITIFEGYGTTAALPVTNSATNSYAPGSCGKVFDGIEVKIVDTRGLPVPCGQVGELLLRGASIQTQAKSRTGERISLGEDGWLETGDLMYQDALGFLYFVGRARPFTKLSGRMIDLLEVFERVAPVGASAFGARE